MAFIPVVNVAKLVMRYGQHGRVYTNTTYWYRPSGWLESNLLDLASGGVAQWETWIAPLVSDSVSVLGGVAYDMSASDAPVMTFEPVGGSAGALTSPAMPGNVTLTISLRTGGRGKSARGRIYHIGLVESQVTANAISGDLAGDLEEAYENYFGDVETDATAAFGIVSYQFEGVPRTAGLFQDVTGIIVNTGIDTQRRRVKPV